MSTTKDVLEASLERLYRRHKDHAFVILTGGDGDGVDGLKQQVHASGHRWVQLDCVGPTVAGDDALIVPCILVPALEYGEDEGALLELALTWARAVDVDKTNIFYANGVGEAAAIRGGDGFALSELTVDLLHEFYAQLYVGSPFSLEEIRYARFPRGWLEGMAREAKGELFDYCEEPWPLIEGPELEKDRARWRRIESVRQSLPRDDAKWESRAPEEFALLRAQAEAPESDMLSNESLRAWVAVLVGDPESRVSDERALAAKWMPGADAEDVAAQDRRVSVMRRVMVQKAEPRLMNILGKLSAKLWEEIHGPKHR